MKKLFKALHIHVFNTPIVSRYVSFNTRDIIYECRCGCRTKKRISRAFGSAFPINTNSLDYKQFQEVLEGKESETTLICLEISRKVNKQVFG